MGNEIPERGEAKVLDRGSYLIENLPADEALGTSLLLVKMPSPLKS